MSSAITAAPEVFTAREVARAAGARTSQARALITTGTIATLDGRFMAAADAVRAVRILRGTIAPAEAGALFIPSAPGRSPAGRALAASGALHAAVLGCLVFLTTLGVATAPEQRTKTPVRLVFLAVPGPGGGGGGGGFRQPAPPPKAEMKGASIERSPVPPPRRVITRRPEPQPRKIPPPVRPTPVERPVEPAVAPVAAPAAQVVAPVATAPADTRDTAGALDEAPPAPESRGSGSGSGVGTGAGTGIGEGTGAGIGPGSGGGTGGGPYRPGSGIAPPGLLREVRPDYTEEARRRGIEGDVVLEIVVRADGTVGNVKVLQGLGGGLDQRAIDAVRQWRFSPARRFGTPVDVMVEVAVEFSLR
jgi:periplasmic protein TonB